MDYPDQDAALWIVDEVVSWRLVNAVDGSAVGGPFKEAFLASGS